MKLQTCDTRTFLHLVRRATVNDFNRSPDENRIREVLDPKGVHICHFAMVHEHRAGVKCEPHMRTMWMCKQRGSMEPLTMVLDIEIDAFEALDTLDHHDERLMDA